MDTKFRNSQTTNRRWSARFGGQSHIREVAPWFPGSSAPSRKAFLARHLVSRSCFSYWITIERVPWVLWECNTRIAAAPFGFNPHRARRIRECDGISAEGGGFDTQPLT